MGLDKLEQLNLYADGYILGESKTKWVGAKNR